MSIENQHTFKNRQEEIDALKKNIEQLRETLIEKELRIKSLEDTFDELLNQKITELEKNRKQELKELEEKYKRSEELLWKVSIRSDKMIEKQFSRSEELLLNILPYEVAQELKDKGVAEARAFESVTVMFTDFKSFTSITEKLSPDELVTEIDYCFRGFDDIMGKYNLEKIKTIGDSYMAVGGLPVKNETHATDVVNAAKDILNFMSAYRSEKIKEGKIYFEVRIGIHSGNVVAGIVGKKKFAYDIWGDTVNIASRMESCSEPGKINISETTHELIKDKFDCTYRGKIEAKNKGELSMYFVE